MDESTSTGISDCKLCDDESATVWKMYIFYLILAVPSVFVYRFQGSKST